MIPLGILLALSAGTVSASDAPESPVLLASPTKPQLLVGCVSLQPRTEYVKISYVTNAGETTPTSAEATISESAGEVTVVRSPAARNGVRAYNIYAATDVGPDRAFISQNASPIAIGKDFREPSLGWLTSSASSATSSSGDRKSVPRDAMIPLPPTLSSVHCSSIPAHSDYVEVSYIGADGETLVSSESVLSQGPNALTIVRSPEIVPGATAYNVYAIKNNGGTGSGETLQNDVPIPLGKDFEEPSDGWGISGRTIPTFATAHVKQQHVTLPVDRLGGYVDATFPAGPREALVLPLNNAPFGSEITVAASAGLLPDAPATRALSASESAPLDVLETISFIFNQDIVFNGFPTFKLSLPKAVKSAPPYIVEIYDGVTKARIATMPGFSREEFTFLSDFSTPFHALRNRTYYAELVAGAPYAQSLVITKAASSITFSSEDGSVATALLPPPTAASDGTSLSFLSSVTPPVGIPDLQISDARVSSYLSIVATGTVSASGSALVTITLPPSLVKRASQFRLAAYDSGFFSAGWYADIKPSRIDGNVLSFALQLPAFIAFRQYGMALYSVSETTSHKRVNISPGAPGSTPPIIVVGDSLSKLSILPPSTAGCVPGWGPLPDCQYSIDPALSWPGYLARITGRRVRNLAQLGAETIIDEPFGPSMIGLQVPQIPSDTQLVVVDWGDADLGVSDSSLATSQNAWTMTKAILSRAPHTRIIYIGIHCAPDCPKAGVDAWNDMDAMLGKRYGGYVDIGQVGPDGMNAKFPDGGHMSLEAAAAMAARVADVMRTLR
jgi:hypothetical protein